MTLTGAGAYEAASDIKELETSIEALRAAMVDADKQALEKLTADELTYGHSGGYVEDKEEFIEGLVSGKSDFVSIGLSAQSIRVTGNTATVRHNLAAVTNDKGMPGSVYLHVLSVWIRRKGRWELLARQAVKPAGQY